MGFAAINRIFHPQLEQKPASNAKMQEERTYGVWTSINNPPDQRLDNENNAGNQVSNP